MKKPVSTSDWKISREEALAHLESLCRSPSFANSKRCQDFLHFVVKETLDCHTDQIKERTIAHEVFGKGLNFEPGEYSLVRVKAGEVRKRLAEYYLSNPDQRLRIDLPLGSYVPQITSVPQIPSIADPVETTTPEAFEVATGGRRGSRSLTRRQFGWLAAGTACAALGSGSVSFFLRKTSNKLELFWRPVFATKLPLLIFLPVMHYDDGRLTEWVGIGPAAALGSATDFLVSHHYPYHLRFGAELTYSQLREQPSLLLGGFGADWTHRMTSDLRFSPTLTDGGDRGFRDRETNEVWKAIKKPSSPYVDIDFGLLCRLFDAATGQIVFLAVGTNTFGTEGAAEVLFNPVLFAEAVQKAPIGWETKNFQALIKVSIIGATPSSPQLIATHFW